MRVDYNGGGGYPAAFRRLCSGVCFRVYEFRVCSGKKTNALHFTVEFYIEIWYTGVVSNDIQSATYGFILKNYIQVVSADD